MAVQYNNNATTTLNGSITNVATSITVNDASVFPAVTTASGDHMYLTLLEGTSVEIIRVTDVTGNVLTCTRGHDGTSGTAFATAARIDLRVTTILIQEVLAENKAGMYWKDGVLNATTANITLSGEQTIDGVLTSTSRILVKDQTLPEDNGIYVTAAGAWTRATDMDAWNEVISSVVAVQQGTLNADKIYISEADAGGTLETTSINFTNFGATGPLVFSPASDTPGVNDDDAGTDGNGIFAEGSVWVNKATDIIYQCTDASTGAAIWVKMAPINKVIALAAAL